MSALALRLEEVVKRFGSLRAVDGVSLEIPVGSVYGLIGPNGAGKTTTFSLVSGWLRPNSGRVEVLGTDPRQIHRLKGRFAALPQDASLPPNTSLIQSLSYFARLQGLSRPASKVAAEEALALVGLKEWSKVRALTLSHGMAKRVGLAQAFLGKPELVLLDEPTAGLDPKNAHHLRNLIREMRGESTILISSHNLYELEDLCDHAAILDRGKVLTSGSMATLSAADREVVIVLADVDGERFAAAVEKLPQVKSASFEVKVRELTVTFGDEPGETHLTTTVLEALIGAGARIEAVRKGRGLERRVLEIT
ncbi:MAG: ABC transporter ATP-binding protein [Deltaproteobacteria bacterium]|nr:ABC transporter ATP-binding protein [Deltaproteobacteria bacterium]